MRHKLSLYPALVILGTGLSVACASTSIFAQSSSHEKQKDKDFGSTLSRLKWDPKKNAASETKSKEDQGKSSDEEVVQVETSLVVCNALVFDAQGHQVQGLKQSDFLVTEDGKPQQVGTFALGDNAALPRSIVLVLDYSLNQSGFLETSVDAAKTLVDGLNPRDRMAIVTDDIKLLADFTQDKHKLKEKLDSLKSLPTSSRTFDRENKFTRGAHFSALLAVLNELFREEDRRPVIIFQANGNEASILRNPIVGPPEPPANLPREEQKEAQKHYQSFLRLQERTSSLREFSLDDVYRAAGRSRAIIYTIVPGYRLIGLSPDEQVKRAKLWTLRFRIGLADATSTGRSEVGQRLSEGTPDWMWGWVADCLAKEQSALAVLARITGGWTDFIEEPSQAARVYGNILSDINSRYVIGYYPSNKEHDGQRRKIRVEVRGHPEYSVPGRSVYYAPGPGQ
jgi:VWFA-related protein